MTLTAATIKKVRALGLSDELFDRVLEIIEEAKAKQPKKGDTADRAARGTRLDKDWVLPRSWGVWAMQSFNFTEHEVRRLGEEFGDYWRGVAGSKGVKLDWEGTWRNRVRDRANYLGKREAAPAGAAKVVAGPSTFSPETWAAIMRAYARTHQWRPENGPEPGKPGCLVPVDILGANRKTLFDSPRESCHT